ncbi:MAG: autotransporter domain-containing protein [Akkermansia sp.]|nr:autotransporter domain-containing protein [Akkermansia sp.]
MKKSLFITMLAAALMGSQVLAEEFIPTTVTGATRMDDWSYAGSYSTTDDVSGANVTIEEDLIHGEEFWWGYVFGGETEGTDKTATNNSVTMSGGEVEFVFGGNSTYGNATNNTATISGGKVGAVYGGYSQYGNAENNAAYILGGKIGSVIGGCGSGGYANGNTVVLSGGEVTGGVVAGSGSTGASYNHVYLVGKGASVVIGGQTYTGSAQGVKVGGVVSAGQAAGGATLSNNTIEIYGTDISVQGISDAQAINYHITESLLSTADPMVTVTTQEGDFYVFYPWSNFIGDETTDWTAFAGQSITLMQSELPIAIVTETDVDITDREGNVLATATLTLGGPDDTSLYLTFDGGSTGPDALDVTLVNSLWASSAYVREFVRLSEAQGYALKAGDTAMWGGGFGTFMHVTGDKGFKSNGGGYGIGVNHAFSDNTQGGLSFGQGFGSYHNSGADGATVHQRAILAAATASTRIGKDFSLGGHLAYGSVRNRADCRLEGATERARWNDNVFNLGARAAYDFHATEATAITPFLGLDWMYGAQESINGAYARHYSHGRLNELRMPVGVTVSTSAEVGSTKLLPQLTVAYVPSLAQQNPHAGVSTNGADYRVKGYAPGRNAFMLNVGMNAIFSENWSAGASYTLETRRHAVDQSVNASVRYTF